MLPDHLAGSGRERHGRGGSILDDPRQPETLHPYHDSPTLHWTYGRICLLSVSGHVDFIPAEKGKFAGLDARAGVVTLSAATATTSTAEIAQAVRRPAAAPMRASSEPNNATPRTRR